MCPASHHASRGAERKRHVSLLLSSWGCQLLARGCSWCSWVLVVLVGARGCMLSAACLWVHDMDAGRHCMSVEAHP